MFFGPNLHRKGVIMLWAMPKVGKTFFGRNNKSRLSAFRKFLFYQNIVCFDWVMNLFLLCVFCQERASCVEIPKPKTKTIGNSTWFFLDYPWKLNFFFNWPLEFPLAISPKPLEIPCPESPVWVFSRITQLLKCLENDYF